MKVVKLSPFVLVILLCQLSASDPRLKHGEFCEPENWCDYSKWLWCGSDRKCACLHPQRQVFDLLRNRCVGLIGTECNSYIGDHECPINSYCLWTNGRATCKCNKGLYMAKDRSWCSEYPQHGAIVENDIQIFETIDDTTTKKSLPIYQYHQQRLGDINYRYKLPTIHPTRTNFLAKQKIEDVVNSGSNSNEFKNNEQQLIVNNNVDERIKNSLQENSNNEVWKRLRALLLANRHSNIFF